MIDDESELRELQIDSWNLKHAQDHFKGLLERLEDSDMSGFLDHLEEMAAALDIPLDLDKVEDELRAL